jgi:hypothetical protein
MRNLLLVMSLFFMGSAGFSATKYTPMHIVEKSSYQIDSLIKKHKIDPSFLTDVTDVTVKENNSEFVVQLTSPSSQENQVNTLDMVFGADAKLKSFTTQFYDLAKTSPILTGINVAQVLDLGAEAFVDHLHESQENVLIAETVQHIKLEKVENGVTLRIKLKDDRIYSITLNNEGNIISRGF